MTGRDWLFLAFGFLGGGILFDALWRITIRQADKLIAIQREHIALLEQDQPQ